MSKICFVWWFSINCDLYFCFEHESLTALHSLSMPWIQHIISFFFFSFLFIPQEIIIRGVTMPFLPLNWAVYWTQSKEGNYKQLWKFAIFFGSRLKQTEFIKNLLPEVWAQTVGLLICTAEIVYCDIILKRLQALGLLVCCRERMSLITLS